METPETIRTSLLQGEWVTSVDFTDAYFHIPIQEQSRKYLRFQVQDRTYQFKALPFGLSTAPMEFTVVTKEVKLMAIHKGIRIHQYLDDWLVRAKSPPNLSPTYPDAGQNMPGSGLVGEFGKIRTGTQTNLQLCRLPVRPQVRPGPTDTGPVAKSSREDTSTFVTTGLSGPTVHVPDRPANSHRKTTSLRPVTHETHSVASKKHWRVPESLEKVIPLPRSLHPHLQWWLEESNVLQGQPLHPIKHALQIFTDASKEGWGAHLNEFTARGSWSVPESKLHINYLELKAVFLVLKEFQSLCVDKIVLVATDNTTVVAYINKEGGMRSGPLCALLWRILTWCSQRQVTLKA